MTAEPADIATSSDAYAARFAGPSGAWLLGVQERLTLAALRAAGARTVLDVGGGHGQLARPMVRDGFDVTVLGSAPVCAHRIRDLVDAQRCRFVTGDVLQLPFPDRSFDAVLSFRLVMHCDEWPRLVAEFCRVARHTVVIDYPLQSGLNALAPWLFAAKKSLERNTRTWRNFRHAELAEAFARHHFLRASRQGQFLWPMVLHRALKSPALSAALESATLGLNRRLGSPVIAAFTRQP
jgi:SAM-dependent methyltransferase